MLDLATLDVRFYDARQVAQARSWAEQQINQYFHFPLDLEREKEDQALVALHRAVCVRQREF